jgi:hypothetical protein
MTDPAQSGDLASLEPLEPLDSGVPAGGQAMASDDAMLATLRSGLGAPAYNPYCRDKSFYRFLFSGVIMFAGCMMPFGAELARPGYTTMAGGFYTLIAVAMIWSWWASIANNRPVGLKWLLFAAVPLVGSMLGMAAFDPAEAHATALKAGWLREGDWLTWSENWKSAFADLGSAAAKDSAAGARVGGFWRLLGVGNVFVFLGALLAELGFIGGIIGGAKKNKADQKQKQLAVAERKRR